MIKKKQKTFHLAELPFRQKLKGLFKMVIENRNEVNIEEMFTASFVYLHNIVPVQIRM